MRYLAGLSLLLFTCVSFAATQVDVYHTEVTLVPQLDESQAKEQGMLNVLVRATGNPDVTQNIVIQKALKYSNAYLSQISYGQKDELKTIKMTFNASQVKGLLTQAQIPYWPERRPTILTWFVKDESFQRTIAWENSHSPDLLQLKDISEKKGLPLLFPVGDFDDITGIEPSDIWGEFVQPISQASERYHPNAILVIREDQQNIRWTLYDSTPDKMMDFNAPILTGTETVGDTSFSLLIGQLTTYYAKKDSVMVQSQSSQSVLLKVTDLTSHVMGFFSLEKAFNKLSSVAAVDVLKIQGEDVLYRIHLLTPVHEFEQELADLNLITKDTTESIPASQSSVQDSFTNSTHEVPSPSSVTPVPNLTQPAKTPQETSVSQATGADQDTPVAQGADMASDDSSTSPTTHALQPSNDTSGNQDASDKVASHSDTLLLIYHWPHAS